MPDLFIDHCFIYQLPFWLKIQFVITHFRFPTLPALRVITLGVWRGGKREGTGFGLIMHGGSPHVGF